MCCGAACDPVLAFSWVGGILVNASFVALISWGAAVFWPVGTAVRQRWAPQKIAAKKRLEPKKIELIWKSPEFRCGCG